MATSFTSFSSLLLKPPPPRPSRSHNLPIRIPSPPPSPLSLPRRRFPRLVSCAVQDNGGGGGASETLNEEQQEAEEKEEGTKEEEGSKVAEELKAVMAARKKAEEENKGGDFIGGVLEEVREIEWPPFGKVVGTTGVVLAVIAGSSLALLTVNAILAELSDRVFAGKGIQDFFG